ncbi:Threonine-phosphate decarboxylase [Pseudooceanicola marinus]|uniref:Aminotransferase n=1 Tax=Pseudooceanicola marinus TaxID=396013 RepID=A0A1X6ZZL7_9RHOB|nr:threonine-phosphate decarboxylase [Pseudooceanicola marinus]PJE30133.1 pyridoxal phosphate-dependent class II aminotransferase [Pseudooceanicola marinus]SLN65907.1 Threonine-phosphate decarboxylase [Pseudooceanicola marinus]
MSAARDHGGDLDAARAEFGGNRDDWLDLSTGINPEPYPLPAFTAADWAALPDAEAQAALIAAARRFWSVPDEAAVLAVPGASAAIAQVPRLAPPGRVEIPGPTYNEHAAAFTRHRWQVTPDGPARGLVLVHPNNPTGRLHPAPTPHGLTVIDESFCDVTPEESHVSLCPRTDLLVLKSFGKFWGLAGLRLGFVIGAPGPVGRLAEMLGPWPVSGPALRAGTVALADPAWAEATRLRLAGDAARLDSLMQAAGAEPAGGTALFRLYEVENAAAMQSHLARHHIWSRIFPYSTRWVRLGLPPRDRWAQLEAALA